MPEALPKLYKAKHDIRNTTAITLPQDQPLKIKHPSRAFKDKIRRSLGAPPFTCPRPSCRKNSLWCQNIDKNNKGLTASSPGSAKNIKHPC